MSRLNEQTLSSTYLSRAANINPIKLKEKIYPLPLFIDNLGGNNLR